MAAIVGRPDYVFGLDVWTDAVRSAAVTCPHAVSRDLTPWEIEILDVSPLRKEAIAKDGKTAIQVCLEHEFEYFKELKKKITWNNPVSPDERKRLRNRYRELTWREYKISGFNVVYAILNLMFSANNPHLLHALLQLPERTKFTGGDGIAALFTNYYTSDSFITPNKVEKIFGMIRRRFAQRGLTTEDNAALLEFTRMKQDLETLEAKVDDVEDKVWSRGGRIGLAALHEPQPLAGRHAGTSGTTIRPPPRRAAPRTAARGAARSPNRGRNSNLMIV